jgi:hypothetical protein
VAVGPGCRRAGHPRPPGSRPRSMTAPSSPAGGPSTGPRRRADSTEARSPILPAWLRGSRALEFWGPAPRLRRGSSRRRPRSGDRRRQAPGARSPPPGSSSGPGARLGPERVALACSPPVLGRHDGSERNRKPLAKQRHIKNRLRHARPAAIWSRRRRASRGHFLRRTDSGERKGIGSHDVAAEMGPRSRSAGARCADAFGPSRSLTGFGETSATTKAGVFVARSPNAGSRRPAPGWGEQPPREQEQRPSLDRDRGRARIAIGPCTSCATESGPRQDLPPSHAGTEPRFLRSTARAVTFLSC